MKLWEIEYSHWFCDEFCGKMSGFNNSGECIKLQRSAETYAYWYNAASESMDSHLAAKIDVIILNGKDLYRDCVDALQLECTRESRILDFEVKAVNILLQATETSLVKFVVVIVLSTFDF